MKKYLSCILIIITIFSPVCSEQAEYLISCFKALEHPCMGDEVCGMKYVDAVVCISSETCQYKGSLAEHAQCIRSLCHSDHANVQKWLDDYTGCLSYSPIIQLSIIVLCVFVLIY